MVMSFVVHPIIIFVPGTSVALVQLRVVDTSVGVDVAVVKLAIVFWLAPTVIVTDCWAAL